MILDDVSPVMRRTMNLFFLVDCSGSMEGVKIGQVNESISQTIPEIKDISDNNSDVQIKISALQFSNSASWTYDEPRLAEDFRWVDLEADGMTAFGEALKCLEKALHMNNGFMSEAAGSVAPVIILLSDGQPTDDYKHVLSALKTNGWFKAAMKFAIAIGNDCDKKVLEDFTGSSEAVFEVHNREQLKALIRVVSVTSSQVGSRNTNGGTPQDEAVKDIRNELEEKNIPQDSNEEDEWV